MRKIVIEFELPEDIEEDYSDIHPQLVFEDLFPSQIGFRVVSDTAQQGVQSTLLEPEEILHTQCNCPACYRSTTTLQQSG